jgi:hypothetical protein
VQLRSIIGALALMALFLSIGCDPPLPGSSLPQGNEVGPVQTHLAPNAKASLPTSGEVLVVGGVSGSNKSTAKAEFFNPATRKWTKTGSMATPRAGETAVIVTMGLAHPLVLVSGGFNGKSQLKKLVQHITGSALSSEELYDPASGKFTGTGALSATRVGLTATVFPSGPLAGKVLLAGGADSSGTPLNTADIFNPATGTTTPTVNNMTSARAFHTATLLGNGTVLLAGGAMDHSDNLTATGDIFDPATSTFSPTSNSMFEARGAHAAADVGSGLTERVLITGGVASGGIGTLFTSNSAELYNPTTKMFGFISGMHDTRAFQSATVLSDGRVLIAGGFNGTALLMGGVLSFPIGITLNTAEIYDPGANTFTCVGANNSGGCSPSMGFGRAGHTATLFTSGPLNKDVLIAGGLGGRKPRAKATELKTSEVFDPSTGKFKGAGNMTTVRGLFAAALLP